MDKRIIVLVIGVVMLFSSGCGGGGNQTTTGGGSSRSFIGGNGGLVLNFMNDAPPAEVYDTPDSTFDISIRLNNQGEYDVPAGAAKVTITGIDPRDFGNPVLEKPTDFEMKGAKLDAQGNSIPGTIANIDFTNLVFSSKITGTVSFNIKSSVCYKYGGKAIAKMCVIKKLLSPKPSDACQVNGGTVPENSGSPVQISEFSQTAVGKDKISFRFKVSQKDNRGKVFDPTAGAECDETARDKLDKVKIKVDGGQGISLSCSAFNGGTEGIVKLYSGEKDITCTATISNLDNYEKPINIETEYNFMTSTEQQILVRHIGEEE
ncbi:hypothetical protein JXA85_03230 [Candidatus Woesearchaeota archaeon]|nr:hypothetical protein [Candidatus Woesearchaeota archaeon]